MILARRCTIRLTAGQLPDRVPTHQVVWFHAPSTNATNVFLAGSEPDCADPTRRYTLEPNGPLRLQITNLSKLWYHGSATDDNLDLITEVDGEGE